MTKTCAGCARLRSLREAEAEATEEPDAVADEAAARVIKSPRKSLCFFFLSMLNAA